MQNNNEKNFDDSLSSQYVNVSQVRKPVDKLKSNGFNPTSSSKNSNSMDDGFANFANLVSTNKNGFNEGETPLFPNSVYNNLLQNPVKLTPSVQSKLT